MKSFTSLITVLLLALFVNAQNSEYIKSSRVTYIANSGFMVEIGSKKVLLDAIFDNGMYRYYTPLEKTKELMTNALPPFDDVDYIFVSHIHADHFNPHMVMKHLANNKNATLICPQQAVNKLKLDYTAYSKIRDQIITVSPRENNYERFVLNGDEIIASSVKHIEFDNSHIENIAFVVNIDGVKLFHSGDSAPETLDNLKGVTISDLNIDIAFLNDEYGVNRAAKQTNKLISARYNIIMDLETFITEKTLKAFCDRNKLHPKPIIFTKQNDYQDFYINDYYPVNESIQFSMTNESF